jgi:hypothetical protein
MNILNIPNKKKYIKKSGEEKEYIYDQKKYNENYYNKHSDYFKQKYKCEICNKEISISNKSNHINSKKHISNLYRW